MQLSTRLAARACNLVTPLSLINDFGVGAESSGSLKTRLIQMQAECPWVVVANSKDMAVHAALFPNGKLLYFGGYDVDDTHLYDTHTAQITDLPEFTPVGDQPNWTNIFCGGHAWLPDGRLLVAGGMLPNLDEEEGGPPEEQHAHCGMQGGGERGSWVFDFRRSVWSPTDDLNLDPNGSLNSGGRWYPTLVTLHDGRVLAVGGHPDRREDFEGRHNNHLPERYSAATDTWTLLSTETESPFFSVDGYPRLHLVPGGDVFFSTVSNGLNRFFDAHADAFEGEAFGPQTDSVYHKGGGAIDPEECNLSGTTSVLLPLMRGDEYQARVMVCGGAQPERTNLVDGWSPTGARSLEGSPARWFLVAVILPTGHVFVTGGTSTPGSEEVSQAGCVREGEVYDPGIDWDSSTYLPGTGTWTHVERAGVRRHYHSSALLMPDGSVWTAGSNGDGTARELRIEIYRPPYMGQVARPRIEESPAAITYRSTFSVGVAGAGAIRRVALMRCGTVTHAFDGDQRYVDLEFAVSGDDSLSVVAPPDPSIAPPGFYMLWVIDLDAEGNPRPCHQARFVHVGGMSVRTTATGCGIQVPLSLRQDILGFGNGQGTSVRRQLLRMLLEC
ncbi:MAG: galactose oxidase-like domain-containing protein [Pyrinomonadaceae bacterium]